MTKEKEPKKEAEEPEEYVWPKSGEKRKIENGKKLKFCPKCNLWKETKDFPHDYRQIDTLYIYCRECEAKRQYDKHTRKIIQNAEKNGYVVLKVTEPAPVESIDVLKIDVNPKTGKTSEIELAEAE